MTFKITFQYILIGILIFICLLMGWGVGNSCKRITNRNIKIEKYKDSLNNLKGRMEILEQTQLVLNQELSKSLKRIKIQKTKINNLKITIDDKVDSVRYLSNKKSLEYITKWLSERNKVK